MTRFALAALACALSHAADYTALDRYVAAKTEAYRHSLVRTVPSNGATIYQLELTSQNWLTTAEVDKPEWKHWLTIVRPDRLTTSTAVLFIDGGSERSTPDTPNPVLLLAAAQMGGIVVQLSQVPNQPLRFAGENRTRTEDAIIAYTWNRYFETGDERWPARLPMTNAAVRAMDAASEFLATAPGGAVKIENFIVTGASKRGWTAWTTAAVDPRVIAVAPLVIDVLNIQRSFEHHWRAYGFWAPAVRDYEAAGVMNWFGTPQIAALMEIEDPYEYRERLTLPKYLIHSTGDQFFLPDSSQFYFDDLPGEKYLRYVPNTDHGLAGLEAPMNLLAWAQAIVTNYPRPRFYWRANRDEGSLTLRVVNRPSKVLLWQATNPEGRDFRLEKIGAAWKSSAVADENGVHRVTVAQPEKGFTAFFLELTYPGPGDLPLVFTTEVVVTPNVYPFEAPPKPMEDGGLPVREIVDHYEHLYREDERLAKDIGPLEFARTQELVLRNLPPAPGLILDIGGGPGAYAAWLASLGYTVHLGDIVPRHVAQAKALTGIGSALIADARTLPFRNAAADALLLLGPLYHLVDRDARIAALREARRVLRPGGVLFAAAISRFASLLDGLFTAAIDDPEFRAIIERDLRDGQHRSHRPDYFTTAYFHRPAELAAEVSEAGFSVASLAAVEGPAWVAPDFAERWADPERRSALLGFTRSVESEPSLLGMSPHLIATAFA